MGNSNDEFWPDTEWKIESLADKDSSLEGHLASVFHLIQNSNLEKLSSIKDQERSIVIAAFFDDAMCSVYIPNQWIEFFSREKVELEISCYPSNFSQE